MAQNQLVTVTYLRTYVCGYKWHSRHQQLTLQNKSQ